MTSKWNDATTCLQSSGAIVFIIRLELSNSKLATDQGKKLFAAAVESNGGLHEYMMSEAAAALARRRCPSSTQNCLQLVPKSSRPRASAISCLRIKLIGILHAILPAHVQNKTPLASAGSSAQTRAALFPTRLFQADHLPSGSTRSRAGLCCWKTLLADDKSMPAKTEIESGHHFVASRRSTMTQSFSILATLLLLLFVTCRFEQFKTKMQDLRS